MTKVESIFRNFVISIFYNSDDGQSPKEQFYTLEQGDCFESQMCFTFEGECLVFIKRRLQTQKIIRCKAGPGGSCQLRRLAHLLGRLAIQYCGNHNTRDCIIYLSNYLIYLLMVSTYTSTRRHDPEDQHDNIKITK
jgi:hypothetical protein